MSSIHIALPAVEGRGINSKHLEQLSHLASLGIVAVGEYHKHIPWDEPLRTPP